MLQPETPEEADEVKHTKAGQLRAVGIGVRAVQARMDGARDTIIDGVDFDLDETGACLRLQRKLHECAYKLPEYKWPFAADDAYDALKRMDAMGLEISADDLSAGDIIGWPSKRPGHIAIFAGKFFDPSKPDIIIENTSANRGVCGRGTTATRLSKCPQTYRVYRLWR